MTDCYYVILLEMTTFTIVMETLDVRTSYSFHLYISYYCKLESFYTFVIFKQKISVLYLTNFKISNADEEHYDVKIFDSNVFNLVILHDFNVKVYLASRLPLGLQI